MMNDIARSPWLLVVVMMTVLVPILGCPAPGQEEKVSEQGQENGLEFRVEELEAALASSQSDIAALQAALAQVQSELSTALAKLTFISVQDGPVNGLNGPHFIIEGCNVHVRSGSGDTADSTGLTGRGNLIIGYNEQIATPTYGRLGSHNLVVGQRHEYTGYGGLVAGLENAVVGESCTVSGGESNLAVGLRTSVSGGLGNDARIELSSVSGGFNNVAFGRLSSVTGGTSNRAQGELSSVCGGRVNWAGGFASTISGGSDNIANGSAASVSGGTGRTAPNIDDWAAGSLFQDN